MSQKVDLRSMTGFGSVKIERDNLLLEFEIRTVNSRFLDFVFRLPRSYSQFESLLREAISSVLHRGRVEIFVSRKPLSGETCAVELNKPLFEAYYNEYEKLAAKKDLFNQEAQTRAIFDLLNRREVLDFVSEVNEPEKEKGLLLEAANQAAKIVCEMRVAEGKKIGEDIVQRLDKLAKYQQEITALVKDLGSTLRENLDARLKKLAADVQVDETRLAMEVAFLVDRCDVTEELVRINSHIEQFKKIMAKSPNGRKLDFMLQEFSREFNTINSKAQDAAVQNVVVDAKAEIEKIKEQVQNIE